MPKEQSKRQMTAVPGVAVSLPTNYHFSPTSTYTDARCRIQFSQDTTNSGQYPRAFRLYNCDASNGVWAMFNSSRATAAVDATYQVGTTTNGVLLNWESLTAKTDAPAVVLVDPGTASQTLSVTVSSANLITVSLATNASGTLTTTPALLKAAVTALAHSNLTATTATGTSALAAAGTASFTGGVDKDSATARFTAISGQAAANTLTAKQAFFVPAATDRTFAFGDDVVDVVVFAVTASQSAVYIETAYESEVRV